MDDKTLSQYKTLSTVGYVELNNPTLLRISGADRKAFLHNFCTADIKNLEAGQNCEAFVLNDKGKILGILNVISGADHLDIISVPDQFDLLHEHLDKYIFREDVTLSNMNAQLATYFVCGNDADVNLAGLINLPAKSQNSVMTMQEGEITVANIELAGWGYLLIADASKTEQLLNTFETLGIRQCNEAALEVIRVENKTPKYLSDADTGTLPQELQRDEKAISFTKGCYLGQETVARIDALGRVNRLLVGLKFDAEVNSGDEFTANEKKAGSVTSVAWSPKSESWIGLGLVRREFATPGAMLKLESAIATVL